MNVVRLLGWKNRPTGVHHEIEEALFAVQMSGFSSGVFFSLSFLKTLLNKLCLNCMSAPPTPTPTLSQPPNTCHNIIYAGR